jgi:Ca2+-binding RTX toxin-like protein
MNMPSFEHLEDRRLMSVSLAKSVLTITGTNKADTIYVQPMNGQLEVEFNGIVLKRVAMSKVKRVVISGLKGDDSIGATLPANMRAEIDGGRGNDVISGGEGNDAIYGGDGDDLIHGNGGDDMLYGDRGADRLDGGEGDDFFDAQDGATDYIEGGDGNDFARVDPQIKSNGKKDFTQSKDQLVDVEQFDANKIVLM